MKMVRIAVALLLGGWMLQMSWQTFANIGVIGSQAVAGTSYPAWMILGALALLVIHVVRNLLPQGGQTAAFAALLPPGSRSRMRLVCFVALWLAYAALLPQFGFVATTLAAVIISILILDRFSPLIVIPSALLFVVTLKILFRSVFYVSLPEGSMDQLLDEILYRL